MLHEKSQRKQSIIRCSLDTNKFYLCQKDPQLLTLCNSDVSWLGIISDYEERAFVHSNPHQLTVF